MPDNEKNKKIKYPQGKNTLTTCIDELMRELGGTKYKKYSCDELKKFIFNKIDSEVEMKGPMIVIVNNFKAKLNKKKTVEAVLLELNELLFKFFERPQD